MPRQRVVARVVTAVLAAVLVAPFGAAVDGRAYAGRHPAEPAPPPNLDFETGDLTGWTVVSGDAWSGASVSAQDAYWGGPFHQHGRFHLWGYAAAGDTGTGVLRSATFRLPGKEVSFLVGGGNDAERLYVALVRAADDTVLLRQSAHEDEAYIRVTWDTTAWKGEDVYFRIVDAATGGFGHINVDDIRVTDARRADNGLTFTRLGQANQPPAGSAPDRVLYAADPLRPQYHYTPYQGWINDPVGLIQWRGRHQLFSQFNPAAPRWGPMHWAHADSADAVRWRNLPVALYPPAPATPTDLSGVFSGSAVDDNGTLTVVYTVFTDDAAHPGAVRETIGVATSADGTTFTPYAGNPVVAGPPPGSAEGFRDPKVFRDPTDRRWKMVVGSGHEGRGRVQLYASDDLRAWTYVGVLAEGDGSTGAMWECPDLFPLGDSWVLLHSSGGAVHYEVGTYDGTRFVARHRGPVDGGPDFYAGQHYRDDRGRDLLVGWISHWAMPKEPTRLNGWAGAQSVTRELFLRPDGGLGSRPVAELTGLREHPAVRMPAARRIPAGTTVPVARGDALDITVRLDAAPSGASVASLRLRASAGEAAVVRYTAATRTLVLDTTAAGYGTAGEWQAVLPPTADGSVCLRVLLDRSSVEVFTGDGTVLTGRVYPRYEESTAVELAASGGDLRVSDLRAWRMRSSWA
jgi:sucrose-6-phosphate hydrolase SacC (GH32 family)